MPASDRPSDRPCGILFDKDGTLFNFHRTWSRFTEAMLARLAPDEAARRAMARAVGYPPDLLERLGAWASRSGPRPTTPRSPPGRNLP